MIEKNWVEQRAELYWWFSSVLAKELSKSQLEYYLGSEMKNFLTALAQEKSLTPSVRLFEDKLSQLHILKDAQLELAADFCDVFLKSEKESALPYASMYLSKDKQFNSEVTQTFLSLMHDYHFTLNQEMKEPADHIAIILDFVGNLIIKGTNEQEVHQVCDDMLLSWLDDFKQKVERVDQFGFYASFVNLLADFVKLDMQSEV